MPLHPGRAGRPQPASRPDLPGPAPRRAPEPGPGDPLPDLLGANRARILRCVAATTGCTTSELARRTGTSLSSASAHAQVLHRAGLIASTRHANMVIHQLTHLGAGLLTGRTPS
ncbi:ArsR/SmtB family transcription factor [Nonomuraea sp. NPDC051191]|uniref:ArsR/SmtB family transcription factor n=1 Tax=Nonomuraea sp. NPDC051191 TaxID=3364372 RepID=UPI00378D3913